MLGLSNQFRSQINYNNKRPPAAAYIHTYILFIYLFIRSNALRLDELRRTLHLCVYVYSTIPVPEGGSFQAKLLL